MQLEWNDPKLTLHLNQDEAFAITHLIATRGVTITEQELGFWFNTRIDTIREELRRDIIHIILPVVGLQELKDKLDEVKDKL
jgi:hypothetical protein